MALPTFFEFLVHQSRPGFVSNAQLRLCRRHASRFTELAHVASLPLPLTGKGVLFQAASLSRRSSPPADPVR